MTLLTLLFFETRRFTYDSTNSERLALSMSFYSDALASWGLADMERLPIPGPANSWRWKRTGLQVCLPCSPSMHTNQSRSHHPTPPFSRLLYSRPQFFCPNHPRTRWQTTRHSPSIPEHAEIIQTSLLTLPRSFLPMETVIKAFVHAFPSPLCILTNPDTSPFGPANVVPLLGTVSNKLSFQRQSHLLTFGLTKPK